MNRLKQLTTRDQSIWLDYIRRPFVVSGELRKLIKEDDLTDVTLNPPFSMKLSHRVTSMRPSFGAPPTGRWGLSGAVLTRSKSIRSPQWLN